MSDVRAPNTEIPFGVLKCPRTETVIDPFPSNYSGDKVFRDGFDNAARTVAAAFLRGL